MRLTRLFEALDDKDQFGPECGYCMQYGSETGDQQRFHEKHEQAEIMAERAAWEVPGGWNSSAGRQKYSDIFNIEMWRFGYVRQDRRGPWIDKPLKEALDDKDEFTPDRCEYCEVVGHYDRSNIDFDEFHIAHTQSEEVAKDNTGWFDDDTFIDEMRKRGFEKQYYLNSYLWTKISLKEDLDDKDSFEPECTFFGCRTRDDSIAFHEAHEEAETAAANSEERQLEDNIDKRHDIYYRVFNQVMAKHGYLPEYVYGLGWWKPTIKEDLDDQDQFGKIKVLHRYTDEDVGVVYTLEDGSTYLYPYNSHYPVYLIDPTGHINRIDHIDDMPEIDRLMANPPSSPFGPEQRQLWRKIIGQPIAEALDDTDEFSHGYCSACDENGALNPALDLNSFHAAHIASGHAIVDQMQKDVYDTTERVKWKQIGANEYYVPYVQEMVKRGYTLKPTKVRRPGGKIAFAFFKDAPLKEALDDKDEFRKECMWPQCAFRTIDDIEEFHAAHVAATQFAQRAINDNDYRDRFHAEMNRHGYFYHPGDISQIEGWLKKPDPAELPDDLTDDLPIREALDDKDEFTHGGNVHHRQAWDSNENLQHWLITMWDLDNTRRIFASDNIRIAGEYYVRGGKAGGMMVTTNTSNVDDETAERMLQSASSGGIGSYFVDWDQAVADAQRIT